MTFLCVSDGQLAGCGGVILAMSRSTASRLSGRPVLGGEQRVVGLAGRARRARRRRTADGGWGERGGPLFAAFAVAADVGAGAEVDVAAGAGR